MSDVRHPSSLPPEAVAHGVQLALGGASVRALGKALGLSRGHAHGLYTWAPVLAGMPVSASPAPLEELTGKAPAEAGSPAERLTEPYPSVAAGSSPAASGVLDTATARLDAGQASAGAPPPAPQGAEPSAASPPSASDGTATAPVDAPMSPEVRAYYEAEMRRQGYEP